MARIPLVYVPTLDSKTSALIIAARYGYHWETDLAESIRTVAKWNEAVQESLPYLAAREWAGGGKSANWLMAENGNTKRTDPDYIFLNSVAQLNHYLSCAIR